MQYKKILSVAAGCALAAVSATSAQAEDANNSQTVTQSSVKQQLDSSTVTTTRTTTVRRSSSSQVVDVQAGGTEVLVPTGGVRVVTKPAAASSSASASRVVTPSQTAPSTAGSTYQRIDPAAVAANPNLIQRQEIVVKVHEGPNGAKVGDVVSRRVVGVTQLKDVRQGREVSRRDFIPGPQDSSNNYIVREKQERRIIYRDEQVADSNRVIETVIQGEQKPIPVRVIETVEHQDPPAIETRRVERVVTERISTPVVREEVVYTPAAVNNTTVTSITTNEPRYQLVEYRILETPAHYVWEQSDGTNGAIGTLCQVEVPATYRTETRRELVTDSNEVHPEAVITTPNLGGYQNNSGYVTAAGEYDCGFNDRDGKPVWRANELACNDCEVNADNEIICYERVDLPLPESQLPVSAVQTYPIRTATQ